MDCSVEQNDVSAGFGEVAIIGYCREEAVVERWPALVVVRLHSEIKNGRKEKKLK